ncbi:hypothetical protein PR048_022900 [Dryococelus australis]|uniref:Uncharacterized protein n=1 Tax=Dryococelus australis TaxID=614101 RepID=A0ABQ9GSM8_9NEOP|nr:hypothetical protein PR048_022900 [Dryococelus australis]
MFIELINVLNKNIVPTINPMVCYDKFVNRRQLPGEEAVAYMSELRRLASSCRGHDGNKCVGPLTAMKALEVVQFVERCEENVIEVRNSCVGDVHKFHAIGSGNRVFLPPSFGSTFNKNVTCFRCAESGLLQKLVSRGTSQCCSLQRLIMQILLTMSQLHLPHHSFATKCGFVTPKVPMPHHSTMKAYSCYLIVLRVCIQCQCLYKSTMFSYSLPVGLRTWASLSLTIIEEFQDVVKYKHFTCNLPVLVMDGIGPNFLGHISIQGVHFLSTDTSYAGMCNEAFSHTIMNLPAVSGHGRGCYKGPPLHIDINPAAVPVYQQARSVACPLTTKMDEAIAANMKREVWIPEPHQSLVLKYNGILRLCADYKGTMKRALSLDTNKSPTVDQVLSDGCIYGTIDLEEAYT